MLRLINHDDNYPSDPTYTQFDDVTLTVPVPSDFSIGANPTSVTVTQTTGMPASTLRRYRAATRTTEGASAKP